MLKRYLLRRILWAVPLLFGVMTVVFVVFNLIPGDPTDTLLSSRVSEEVREQTLRNWGLDRPLHERYLVWIGNLARGDLGPSYQEGIPAGKLLAQVLPNTLLLSGTALVLAFLLGTVVGVVQAVRQNTLVDGALSFFSLVLYGTPSFLLALLLLLVFGYYAAVADWVVRFPISDVRSIGYDTLGGTGRLLDRLRHLVLPATSLALVLAGGIARFVRSSMLEVIRQDYVRTARAKGLPESVVIRRHVLRNALLPLVTLLGLYLPLLFSGAVFVESVFAWPGMGRTVVEAVLERDYYVVMGGTLLFATIVVIGNLLADVLYAIVDPRVRL